MMRPMGRMFLLILICTIGFIPVFADPVETLRQGGSSSFRIINGRYTLSGAFNASGSLGAQRPIVFNFQETEWSTVLNATSCLRR